MNVTNKVLKGFAVLALMAMSVGCASVGGVANNMVSNTDKSGIIYGTAGYEPDVTVVEVCKAIKNKDPRCVNAEDYVVIPVISKLGFADGSVGINTLVRKDFPNLKQFYRSGTLTDSNAIFVKAKVIPGQLGELVDVVSKNGDGKCYWSGLPRVGGVVCPAYNWDYTKDNQAAIIFR